MVTPIFFVPSLLSACQSQGSSWVHHFLFIHFLQKGTMASMTYKNWMTSAFVQKSFKVSLHTFFCNPMRPNTEKSHQQLGSIENLSFSSSFFFFSFPAKVKYILQSKECPRIGMHLGNSVQDYYF